MAVRLHLVRVPSFTVPYQSGYKCSTGGFGVGDCANKVLFGLDADQQSREFIVRDLTVGLLKESKTVR